MDQYLNWFIIKQLDNYTFCVNIRYCLTLSADANPLIIGLTMITSCNDMEKLSFTLISVK